MTGSCQMDNSQTRAQSAKSKQTRGLPVKSKQTYEPDWISKTPDNPNTAV